MSQADKGSYDLEIPSVTEDDLARFHASHFGSQTLLPPGPSVLSTLSPSDLADAPSGDAYDQDDEDGLGYYADGVKRTLTDDQIAIFRHSEIHALLREKILQAERDLSPTNANQEHKPINAPDKSMDDKNDTKITESNPPSCKRRKRNNHKQNRHLGPSVKSQHIAPDDPQGRTTRRLARELDSLGAQTTIELDY